MKNVAGRVFNDVTLSDLGSIRRYVRETAVALGCDPPAVDELVVVVNEAAANIIRHGYGDEPGRIVVSVAGSDHIVEVTLLDAAPAFDPTRVPSPDTTLPLAERPFGGMGVHMMRAFCDELSYRRTPAGENELRMLIRYDRLTGS